MRRKDVAVSSTWSVSRPRDDDVRADKCVVTSRNKLLRSSQVVICRLRRTDVIATADLRHRVGLYNFGSVRPSYYRQFLVPRSLLDVFFCILRLCSVGLIALVSVYACLFAFVSISQSFK